MAEGTARDLPRRIATSIHVRLDQEREKLRGRGDVHDAYIGAFMDAIGNLLGQPDQSPKRIGFTTSGAEPDFQT